MIVDTNNALSYLEESTLVTNPTHAHRHTHVTDCTFKVKEAMIREGF